MTSKIYHYSLAVIWLGLDLLIPVLVENFSGDLDKIRRVEKMVDG